MFISKMNRMFHKHGRIAFGILTLVIIVPFVLYFSAAPSELLSMFDFRAKASKVQINGKTVSEEVLQNNITNALLTLAISGRNVDFDSMRSQPEVLQMAAERIVLLKTAEERGIQVDDLSVAGFIRQLPMFQVKGEFNINMYKMFVTYYLGRSRISEKDLENAVRENLIINLLQEQTTSSVVATDKEAQNYYNDLNKTYKIQVARFNSADFVKVVNVKPEDLQAYFDKNRDKYLIPAKYKFDAVRFNFINYQSEAEKMVTDKEIDSAYTAEKETTYKGKDESAAKKEIKKKLVEQNCEKLAKNDAQQFAVSAYKLIEQPADNSAGTSSKIFQDFAAKSKYTVHNVDQWVTTETKVIPRLGKVPEITAILGKLYKDQPISNAINGKNAYFVICLSDKVDPRKAELNEVKDKVTAEFKSHEAAKLAQQAAEKAYNDIAEAEKAQKSIDSLGLKFEDVPDFSQKNYMPLLKVKDGIQIYQSVTETGKGSVSKPIDTQDGAAIVYVKDIVNPSDADFEKNKTASEQEYIQFKKWLLWTNFTDSLKLKANIVIADK